MIRAGQMRLQASGQANQPSPRPRHRWACHPLRNTCLACCRQESRRLRTSVLLPVTAVLVMFQKTGKFFPIGCGGLGNLPRSVLVSVRCTAAHEQCKHHDKTYAFHFSIYYDLCKRIDIFTIMQTNVIINKTSNSHINTKQTK